MAAFATDRMIIEIKRDLDETLGALDHLFHTMTLLPTEGRDDAHLVLCVGAKN